MRVVLALVVLIWASPGVNAVGQSLFEHPEDVLRSMPRLALASISEFPDAAPSWRIAGDVASIRTQAGHLEVSSGDGILVFLPSGANQSSMLSTAWAHGDVELDFEVLVPRQAAPRVLLQGRYAVSLKDSWGSEHRSNGSPVGTADDMGGVANRIPAANVARAPGLWQRVNILFRAPEFDTAGRKTRAAEFVRVVLNGVVIQRDILVESVSPQADSSDEVARAPVVLDGTGGVAFRNFRYRLLDGGPARIENVTYTYYRGDFGWEMPDVDVLTEVSSGPAAEITSAFADTSNRFALKFQGDLLLPVSGSYVVEVTTTGQFTLEVDGQVVANIESPDAAVAGDVPRRVAATNLARGRHSFALTYARGRWHRAESALGWYMSGPASVRTRFTGVGSDPETVFEAFKVEPGSTPRLQRSFVAHDGGKRTHAVSVGYPTGNHYAYDTGSGALLHVWRGKFIDASSMWFQRGNEQSAAPRGSLIELRGGSPILVNPDDDSGTPPPGFKFRNYRIDSTGDPVYSYSADGLDVTDDMSQDDTGGYFVRTLTIRGQPGRIVWCLIAEDPEIRASGEAAYEIGRGSYFIEIDRTRVTSTPEIRTAGGVKRLVVPVELVGGEAVVRYSLVW